MMFLLLTFIDILVTSLLSPITWKPWIIIAIAAFLFYFLCAGFLFFQKGRAYFALILATAILFVITGILFLIDVIWILYQLIVLRICQECHYCEKIEPGSAWTFFSKRKRRNTRNVQTSGRSSKTVVIECGVQPPAMYVCNSEGDTGYVHPKQQLTKEVETCAPPIFQDPKPAKETTAIVCHGKVSTPRTRQMTSSRTTETTSCGGTFPMAKDSPPLPCPARNNTPKARQMTSSRTAETTSYGGTFPMAKDSPPLPCPARNTLCEKRTGKHKMVVEQRRTVSVTTRCVPKHHEPTDVKYVCRDGQPTIAENKKTEITASGTQSEYCKATYQLPTALDPVGNIDQNNQQHPPVIAHQYYQNPCICGNTHYKQSTVISGTLLPRGPCCICPQPNMLGIDAGQYNKNSSDDYSTPRHRKADGLDDEDHSSPRSSKVAPTAENAPQQSHRRSNFNEDQDEDKYSSPRNNASQLYDEDKYFQHSRPSVTRTSERMRLCPAYIVPSASVTKIAPDKSEKVIGSRALALDDVWCQCGFTHPQEAETMTTVLHSTARPTEMSRYSMCKLSQQTSETRIITATDIEHAFPTPDKQKLYEDSRTDPRQEHQITPRSIVTRPDSENVTSEGIRICPHPHVCLDEYQKHSPSISISSSNQPSGRRDSSAQVYVDQETDYVICTRNLPNSSSSPEPSPKGSARENGSNVNKLRCLCKKVVGKRGK